MELLLNVIWALLAVTAFAVVLPREAGRDTRRVFQTAVVLACALALLFPIISVSDDLTADLQAVEESSARRTIAAPADAVRAHADFVTPLVAVLVDVTLAAAITLIARRTDLAVVPACAVFLTAQTDPRSPPQF